ncbi:MAG TPA: hypothetical protein VIT91_07050 [Chthoniobacterales bacterium]
MSSIALLRANDTLYTALNAVGKAKGDKFLDSLIVAEGLSGDSQPPRWRFIFDDPEAQGGVRNIEVSGGEIVAESAPRRNPFPFTGLISLNKLQLDSDGAFAVANAEAKRRKIGFDVANFLLRTDGNISAPVWRVELLDSDHKVISMISISADTGMVTRVEGQQGRRDLVGTEETASEPGDANDPNSTEQKIHRGFVNIGQAFRRGFRTVGGSVQEIFTGRRTFDKEYRQPNGQTGETGNLDSDYVTPSAPPPRTLPDD